MTPNDNSTCYQVTHFQLYTNQTHANMNPTMNWSPEQSAIFHWYAHGTGNLVIEAMAGTGKTSTQVEAFSYVHPDVNRILYCVFNKRNQREASEKISDPRVDVITLHALGFRFIKKLWPSAKPDDQVEIDRVARYIPAQDKELIGLTCKLVGLAKNSFVDSSTDDLCGLCETYDLDFATTERKMSAVQAVLRVLVDSKVKDPAGRISFNDMVWLPVALNLVRPTYDLVTVDEAQDMNLLQLLMARGACKPTGRVVIVGDSRQAIYGFRGAVQDGMGMMKESLQAETLSLTTTYRCPKLVVAEAAKLVPAYKAAPEAPEGSVQSIGSAQAAQVGDAILSRLNAPLMPLALSFLRKGISARIEGRDIGRQLIGMIKSLKAVSIEDLLEKLSKWEAKQITRLQDSRNAEKKIETVRDTSETLQAICADCDTVADAEQKLAGLFQDTDEKSRPAIVLSSVHKAKGLEWPRVFLLQETFRASRGGEEANILYVALTRAMRELFLVSAGNGSVTNGNGTLASSALADSSAASAKMPAPSDENRSADEETVVAPLKKSSPPPRKQQSAKAGVSNLDTTDIPTGQVRRRIGDVFSFAATEYVVTNVNSCRASAVCLDRAVKKGEETEMAPKEISVSTCCDKQDVLRRIDNFQSGKPSPKGTKHNNNPGNEENNSMSKEDKTIEILISKAIAAGKDDNKITAMALANYPNVPAAEVIKLIAKGRKSAGKSPTAPPTRKAAPPGRKADPSKTPQIKGSRAGSAEYIRGLAAKGIEKDKAIEMLLKKYPCLTGLTSIIESRWNTAIKLASKVAEETSSKAAAPVKKTASKSAAPVKAPPVRKPKAANTEATTESTESDTPAQGEEVPQE